MNKKILIFIDWYKPGYKAGGPIRSISNIVDYLQNDCKLNIITSDHDYLDQTSYPNIEPNTWLKVDGANVYYLSNDNINFKNIKGLIKETNPALIYCNSLYSFHFSLVPIYLAKKLRIKHVLAVRGMLSSGSLSVKNKKKKLFLFMAKTIGLFKQCTFQATSENEESDIKKKFSANQIVLAQNLPEKKSLSFVNKTKESATLNLVSVGRIAPEKNTLYAINVLHKVKSKIQFDIYGPIYNQTYWDKCLLSINQLPPNIVVNYMKELAHDKIDNILATNHVLFLPSTGENFGHVILEGMINSCVPVISDKTPWKNLVEKNIGFDLPLKNNSVFSTAIDQLAQSTEEEFNIMAKNAHHFAQETINNGQLIEDYHKLFQLND